MYVNLYSFERLLNHVVIADDTSFHITRLPIFKRLEMLLNFEPAFSMFKTKAIVSFSIVYSRSYSNPWNTHPSENMLI